VGGASGDWGSVRLLPAQDTGTGGGLLLGSKVDADIWSLVLLLVLEIIKQASMH